MHLIIQLLKIFSFESTYTLNSFIFMINNYSIHPNTYIVLAISFENI